jgi:hypothetical protein
MPPIRRLAWPLFTLVALAPLCLVQVPGLGDYLNHLARMHVLVSIAHSPDLQQYYQVHWTPIPYLAMDAVVPLLAHILPIYLAGKVFVLACMVMPVAGTACLHYVVHRRLSLVPLAAWLVSYNTLLEFGFLNYLFSLGLALMLFAAWLATAAWPATVASRRWRRAALFAPLVLALYLGHAFACFAYCLAVAGVEANRALQSPLSQLRAVAADLLAAFSQAVPALIFAATLNVNSGYVGTLNTNWGDLRSKLFAACAPFLFLHDQTNAFFLLALIALIALLAASARLAPQIWPACIPVTLAAIAMPHVLDSTWGMDLRLPLFLVLLLVAGASFPRAATLRWPAVAMVFVLLAAKSADAWLALRVLDGQIAETRQVLAALPRGARLLVVNVARRGTGQERVPPITYWHMPLTAVIDRDAFVPYLFNGLTTVRMRPEFRAISTPNGLPISPAQLRDGMTQPAPEGTDLSDGEGGGGRIYWYSWPKNFDYVLIQRFGYDPGKLPENLHLLVHAPDMDLYRIVR